MSVPRGPGRIVGCSVVRTCNDPVPISRMELAWARLLAHVETLPDPTPRGVSWVCTHMSRGPKGDSPVFRERPPE